MAAKRKGGRGGPRPGSGRPPILEDPVSYRVNLERDDYDALRQMAEETSTSAMKIARNAIHQVLTRYFQKRRRRRKTT